MLEQMVDKFGSVYQAGTVVFRVGDHGDEMYIIHEGEVQISIAAKNAEQVLARLKGGDFFGEMAIFTANPRSATAMVTEKSVIMKIKRESIEYILENNPSFAQKLIQKLCNRISNTNSQVEELLILSKETRLLKAIVSYWREAGTKDKSGEQLLIALDPFVEYVSTTMGISAADTKKGLNELKGQDLLRFRRDQENKIFVCFTGKLFDYFDFS